MKKIQSLLLIAATSLGILTSCSDVPMPYDINAGGSTSYGKLMPYKNASLSTFTSYDLIEGCPAWSQGSSYTQATGYQAWDGASTKSNKEVKSYLISPPLNTTCASGKVRFSFDQTLRYSNNVSTWKENHKIYISKDFDGNAKNFDQATWTLIDFTPEASTYSDWTLYSSGYIQVPDEFVNYDGVYIAFYFYAPASASTTWELENFLIEEGVADNSGQGGDNTPESVGTKEAPLSVADAKNKVGSTGYVTGYIVGYVDGQKLEDGAKFEPATESQTELLLADTPNETNPANTLPVQLPVGALRDALNPSLANNIGQKVTLYGSFENYFGVPGMKSTTWAEMNGQTYGKDPDATEEIVGTPTGTGTQEDPFNVAAVYAFAAAGNYSNSNPSKEVYVKGIVSQVADLNTKYNELNYYISDDGTTAGQFYVYNGYGLNGEAINSTEYLKVGDVVLICGKITTYNGTHEFTYGSKIISLNGNGEGGGDTPNPPAPTGNWTREADTGFVNFINTLRTASNRTTTLVLADLQLENAQEPGILYFPDQTELSFEAGSNKNAPKYYTASNGVRVYANNNVIIKANSPIARIEMECDVYTAQDGKQTSYVGNSTTTIAEENNTITICNAAPDAGTQLRIKVITITYAE